MVAGIANFVTTSLKNNKRRPRRSTRRPLRVGEDYAASRARFVVGKRNAVELMPSTRRRRRRVHCGSRCCASPPWIQQVIRHGPWAPGRSFLEWAVQHERTCSTISYRNPESYGRYDPDDIIIQFARGKRSGRHRRDHGGRPKIDIIGLAWGGALTGAIARRLPRFFFFSCREGRRQDRLDHAGSTRCRLQRAGASAPSPTRKTVCWLRGDSQSAEQGRCVLRPARWPAPSGHTARQRT